MSETNEHDGPQQEAEDNNDQKGKKTALKVNLKKLLTALAVILVIIGGFGGYKHHKKTVAENQQRKARQEQQQNRLVQQQLATMVRKRANARPPAVGENSTTVTGVPNNGEIPDDDLSDLIGDNKPARKDQKESIAEQSANPAASAQAVPSTPNAAPPAGATTPVAPVPPPAATPNTPSPQSQPAQAAQTTMPVPAPQTAASPSEVKPASPLLAGKTEDITNNGQTPKQPVTGFENLKSMPSPFDIAAKDELGKTQTAPVAPSTEKTTEWKNSLTSDYEQTQARIASEQAHLRDIEQKLHTGQPAGYESPLPQLPGDPKATEETLAEAPRTVITNQHLSSISPQGATVTDGKTSRYYPMGSIIPGIGKARSIMPWNGTYELSTDSGLIRPEE